MSTKVADKNEGDRRGDAVCGDGRSGGFPARLRELLASLTPEAAANTLPALLDHIAKQDAEIARLLANDRRYRFLQHHAEIVCWVMAGDESRHQWLASEDTVETADHSLDAAIDALAQVKEDQQG